MVPFQISIGTRTSREDNNDSDPDAASEVRGQDDHDAKHDPLVVAWTQARQIPTLLEIIPGTRRQAQIQDQDQTIGMVKKWVKEEKAPERIMVDFGHPDLKAYAKIRTILKLIGLPHAKKGEDMKILVKTDIEGTKLSERYCVPEALIDEPHSRTPSQAGPL